MEFERGGKKNQLIWSFILKVIASQSLVKPLFLNKTRKENDSEENTLSQSRRRTRGFAPSLKQRENGRAGHRQWVQRAHWSGLTVLPSFSSLLPDGSGAPAIASDERRLLEGIRGRGWTGQTEAVLLVVAGSSEVEGVAGGELRGGRQLREVWGFGLRWFLDAAEGSGGSAWSRGGGWWC